MTKAQQMIKLASKALETNMTAYVELDGFALSAFRSDGNVKPGKFIKRWYNSQGDKIKESAIN